jgi:hypothetical protein
MLETDGSEICSWSVIIHDDTICDRRFKVVDVSGLYYAQSSERLDFRRVPELAAAGLASYCNEQLRAKSNNPEGQGSGKVL